MMQTEEKKNELTNTMRIAWGLTVVVAAAVFVLYTDTFFSMVKVWSVSDSYQHGFLIIPLSLLFIWSVRDSWLGIEPKPSFLALIFLAIAVAVWLIASRVNVQVLAQLAFVAMLVSVVWLILGSRIAKRIRFALLYAFFAVPFGAFLVPTLMEWTATFTVAALQLTGIPVFRQGQFFSLPSGDFEVIAACSGINYLLVTVILGLYFAQRTYTSIRKRAIFVVLVAAAMMVGNGIRAYLVVIIAHYSNMKYGTGVDHILVGQILFIVIILLTFSIGNRFADETATVTSTGGDGQEPGNRAAYLGSSLAAGAGVAILLAGVALADWNAGVPVRAGAGLSLPVIDTWRGPAEAASGFQPAFVGYTARVSGSYQRGSKTVEMHSIVYAEQEQGGELISSKNSVADRDVWRLQSQGRERIDVPESKSAFDVLPVLLTHKKTGEQVLVWYWYDVGERKTLSPIGAKLIQGWKVVTSNRATDGVVILAVPVADSDIDSASRPLREFLTEGSRSIDVCLRSEESGDARCAESQQER